jgi:serine/threonine protein kinase
MVAITKSLQRKTQTTFLSYLLGEKPQDSGDITTAIMSSFEDFKELLERHGLYEERYLNNYIEMKNRFRYKRDKKSRHIKVYDGLFTQVLEGTDTEHNANVVVKKTLKNCGRNELHIIFDEIKALECLSKVTDLSIPRYYGYSFCNGPFSIKLIMEQIPENDLFDNIVDGKITSLVEVIEITRQLIEALVVFEREGYQHCDIKPENLIWYKGKLYIVDLGDAKKIDPETKTVIIEPDECIQTLSCKSPESFLKAKLDSSLDIWSVGCVIYVMLTRICLFSYNRKDYSHQQQTFQVFSSIYYLLGLPPCEMLENGAETHKYFIQDDSTKEWSLRKTDIPRMNNTYYDIKNNLKSCFKGRDYDVNKLTQLIKLFVSYKRPKPTEALKEFYKRFQKPDVMV